MYQSLRGCRSKRPGSALEICKRLMVYVEKPCHSTQTVLSKGAAVKSIIGRSR
uniref:Uncharacterized protein n=1 Tax=Arundo donax TaxID=35708 RepID=A0A0A8Z8I8_ARUDO